MRTLAAAALSLLLAAPASAIDEARLAAATSMISTSIAWLRARQDASGGWAVPPAESGQPVFPAITGLVLTGFILDPAIDESDPAVQRAADFILKFRQPDGGIYDRVLPSYNTAICLSALSRLRQPRAVEAVAPAVAFLRGLQWSEDAGEGREDAARVDPSHPFYGGVGYGRHGRPDNSNLAFFVEALHDAGVPSNDPAFQRALVFLRRTQMDDRVNDMPYAEGSRQGGFVYATAENRDTPGQGQSQVGTITETLDDGTQVSRLRAYGSMTYAGFKSMIFADLSREDERVRLAYDWLRRNYTVQENPGAGTDGVYYYFLMMSRALDAWGSPTIDTLVPPAGPRDWQNDLVDRLAGLQSEDGSFRSLDDRWMEDNTVLITAYSLLALQHIVN